MVSLSMILFPFLIHNAASFRFSPLPLIQRRSSILPANSFLASDSYKQQSQFQKQGGWNNEELMSPPMESVSGTNIIAKADSLYSRIEETMKFAGFESPMHSSGKNTILILLLLYGIKIFRNKFLLKGQSKLNEFQPTWGHVVTSKEEEANLHAYTCKKCGATIFIAKGREWRFFSPFVECSNCGAKGKENFYDRRKEIVDEVDDGTFIYESFVDYNMSKRAQKKMMEEKKRVEEQQKKFEAEEAARVLAQTEQEGSVAVAAEPVATVMEKVDVEEDKEKEETAVEVKEEEEAKHEVKLATPVKEANVKPSSPKGKSRPGTSTADLDILDMDG